jgi:hypothetical protein
MDNSASTDIVNQDSDIKATELGTLPPLPTTQATEPPTESDLGSHLDEKTSWRDGAEVILSAADIIPIPGVGTAIKAVISASLGLGKYSPDERLKDKQFKWVVSEIEKISHKINILIQKLPPDEQIEAADVAAIINAAMKASEKTADAKKRKLLKNAVVNAFDIEQYQEGMTLRLFSIFEDVEYGDVEMLHRVFQKKGTNTPASDYKNTDSLSKSGNSASTDMCDISVHHLEILRRQDLILCFNGVQPELLESVTVGYILITDLGKKFLY